jgi:hypothetical protein
VYHKNDLVFKIFGDDKTNEKVFTIKEVGTKENIVSVIKLNSLVRHRPTFLQVVPLCLKHYAENPNAISHRFGIIG